MTDETVADQVKRFLKEAAAYADNDQWEPAIEMAELAVKEYWDADESEFRGPSDAL